MNIRVKQKLILALLTAPFIVSIVVHVVVINTLTIDGKKLSVVEKNIAELKRENQLLQYQVSKLGSTDTIKSRAESLGMSAVEVAFSVKPAVNIALGD